MPAEVRCGWPRLFGKLYDQKIAVERRSGQLRRWRGSTESGCRLRSTLTHRLGRSNTRPLSRPAVTVQAAILDGFSQVFGQDVVGTRQVGDRPRHLEHTVVPSRAQAEATHRRL